MGPFFIDFDESITDRPTDLPMDRPSYRDADASGNDSSKQKKVCWLNFLKNERKRVGFVET